MNRQIRRSSYQNGRSMVEILGVLAIIGVLSVAGIAGYSKAMNKYRLNKTTEQVAMIVSNAHSVFAGQRTYEGLKADENEKAIQLGLIPDEMVVSRNCTGTKCIRHALGGYLGIAACGASSGTSVLKVENTGLCVVLNQLSKEACVALATVNWGGTAVGIKTQNYVDNPTEVFQPGNIGPNIPLSLQKAAEGCGTCSSSGCSVKFTFR